MDNAPGRIDSTRLIAALLLTMMALVLGVLAWQQSPNYDEHTHVAAGVSYLERRDGRMNVEHPPLVKLLGGAGALIAGASGDYNSDAWRYAREFDFAIDLYTHTDRSHLQMLKFLPRVPMILITLALGLTIYLWVSTISGRGAGLLALALYCTYPLFLAWGVFVLNDVAVALFSLLTGWAAVAMWRNPSAPQIVRFGLALGAALFAKFSAVLLFPALGLWLLTMLWLDWKELSRERLRKLAWALEGGLLVAGAVVYFAYQLTFWQMPPHEFVRVWQERAQVQGTARTAEQQRKITTLRETLEKHPVAERMISPVFYYATGMYAVSVSTKRPSLILGEHYPTGRWFYFPVVALYKSPPGFLVIVGFGFLLLILACPQMAAKPRCHDHGFDVYCFHRGIHLVGNQYWNASLDSFCRLCHRVGLHCPGARDHGVPRSMAQGCGCGLRTCRPANSFRPGRDLPFLYAVLQFPAGQPPPRLGLSRFQR